MGQISTPLHGPDSVDESVGVRWIGKGVDALLDKLTGGSAG